MGFHVTVLMDVGPMTTSLSNNEHRVRFLLVRKQNSLCLKTDLNAKLYISK